MYLNLQSLKAQVSMTLAVIIAERTAEAVQVSQVLLFV